MCPELEVHSVLVEQILEAVQVHQRNALAHNALVHGAIIAVVVAAVHGSVSHGDDPRPLTATLGARGLLQILFEPLVLVFNLQETVLDEKIKFR